MAGGRLSRLYINFPDSLTPAPLLLPSSPPPPARQFVPLAVWGWRMFVRSFGVRLPLHTYVRRGRPLRLRCSFIYRVSRWRALWTTRLWGFGFGNAPPRPCDNVGEECDRLLTDRRRGSLTSPWRRSNFSYLEVRTMSGHASLSLQAICMRDVSFVLLFKFHKVEPSKGPKCKSHRYFLQKILIPRK